MDWNLTEFRKPINLTFLGVGGVGLLLSVITFLWSRHEADISYHTATIQIVDQKEAVPISVIQRGSRTLPLCARLGCVASI